MCSISDGPDNLSASEARARVASPGRGRHHQHHIHIQQQPGYIPSMTFRLNVARELLARANRLLNRFENPDEDNATAENSTNGRESVNVSINNINVGGIPPQMAQAIHSAVNNAVQNLTTGGSARLGGGQFEMSVSIDQNGQIISQSGLSRQETTSGSQTTSTSSTTTTTETTTSSSTTETTTPEATSTGAAASTGPSASNAGTQSGGQLQHPPLSELADAMDELSRTEDRFRPFRQQMYDILRNDPTYPSDQERQSAQELFNRSMEILHIISHVQHALSDANINLAQNVPRHIRASPLVIQSRSTYFQSVPVSIGGHPAGPQRNASSRASSASRASASTSASSNSTTSTSSSGPSQAEAERGNGPEGIIHGLHGGLREVEVNVEPIIVGIEMEATEATGSPGAARMAGAAANLNGSNLMQMFQSALMNAAGGGRQPANAPPSGSTASSGTTTSSTGTSSSTSSGQDSQARGGAQTQPTTSTHTRSSAHVHYAPRGSMGINLSPMMMSQPSPSFDPLLPCNSHHIQGNHGRGGRHHPASHLMSSARTRSASVPPRGNAANGNRPVPENANRQDQPQASSARSSPQRLPRMRTAPNLDFVTTHVDIVPMIMTSEGVMAFGSPARSAAGAGGQRASQMGGGNNNAGSGRPMEPVEPSLHSLLSNNLQSNDPGGDNGAMLNVVMSIINEIHGATTGSAREGPRRPISSYLENMPDYTYVEGQSILLDLLMLVARHTTVHDLINIQMGAAHSLDGLQVPLRTFLRRYVLVPPNDDEDHDIDPAILHLIDTSFSHLEEMSNEANVRPDLDLPETLHSFLAANLSGLAETVLRSSTAEEFGIQFRERGTAFMSRLTLLCLRCFVDGNVSLERVARNRLEAISGDAAVFVRDWILSASVGHLRNYVASINSDSSLQNEDIDQYLVHAGVEADQRKAARRRRLQQHQLREDETFVTPRSSPPRASPVAMEVDENANPGAASEDDTLLGPSVEDIPEVSVEQQTFPSAVSLKSFFYFHAGY